MPTQKNQPLNFNRLTTELSDPEQIQQAVSAKKPASLAPADVFADAFVAPQTPTEKKVAAIWARALGLKRVGLRDDFFKLGGHSLLATQVLSEVSRAFDTELPITLAYGPAFTVAAVVNALAESESKPAEPPLQRIETQASYPLSFGQQRLWWLHQLEPDNPAYNTLVTLRFTGPLNSTLLERSLNDILQRHESLRTVFIVEAEQPRQVIQPVLDFELPVVDLRYLPETEREAEARRRAVQQTREPFDLSQGPLLRVTLLQLRDDEHWLLVTVHHIIGDGWSAQVLIEDVAAAYHARISGEASSLSDLPLRYIDYADWQRERLQGAALEAHLTYWQQRLAGLPTLALLTDHPRPPRQTFRGETRWIDIDAQLTESLRTVAQRESASLFMLLLTAFQVLLCRYTGQEDIVVGTPVANRTRPELERLVGFFVNSLVLRNDLAGDPTFLEALHRIRAGALEAYAHQDLPFERLVDSLRPERDLSRNPLFQVLIALTPPSASNLELSDFNFNEIDIDTGTAKFDLSLLFKETAQGLHGAFEYNTDLFDAATITRMAAHFETLLRGIAADPEQRLSQLPLLTEAERQELITWNAAEADYPREHCLHELFEMQVERTPNAIAVVYEKQRVTYAELNQRANQLAHHLMSLGVGPETLVGICVDRSVEMVVGLLGILKAGAAYVPLDPTYPEERLAFMLEDSQTRVLLTQSHLLKTPNSQTPNPKTLVTLCLDTDWPSISQSAISNPQSSISPENLAYLIYTSGSTGRPKGVPVSHANVVRLFEATADWYHFNADDVWTLFHSYAFDFSVWELWGALLYGGRLVVVPYWVSRAPDVFYRLLQSEGVTVLNQTPSAFRQFVQAEQELKTLADSALRLVIFGGEALELHSLKPWWERHGDRQPQLVNMYGITETTVHVTYRPLSLADLDSGSMIGQTIPDLQLYILDRHLAPVPLGVPGELYVGGAGLARGYLGRPELTAERFIPNPFLEKDEVGGMKDEKNTEHGDAFILHPLREAFRLYKTGDLARRLPNGDIEYLGRIDHQVKLRGFRIELEEIESALNQYPGIQASVVVLREEVTGQRLVAYLVSRNVLSSDLAELRRFLKIHLPDYMIPSDFVFLDALPLTPNGKVDRRALPAPSGSRSFEHSFVAPRTPLEELLANSWAEVLHLERIGVHDNFFELGGHSLLATQVVSRMRKALQIDLPLRTLFEASTIESLAQEIERLQPEEPGKRVPVIPTMARAGNLPPSFAQERLWFLDQLEPGRATYNMPAVLRLTGQLEIAALENSLNGVLQRQESLRTTIEMSEGKPHLTIAPHLNLKLEITDLSHLSEHERAAEAQDRIHAEARRPFDLATGPLCRAQLLRLTPTEHLLLMTLHHIISDGWSMGILIQEVTTLYAADVVGRPIDLLVLPVQYADFAAWQRGAAQSEVIERQLAFWKEALAGAPTRLELPTDHPRPASQSFSGATKLFTLPLSLSTTLRDFSRQADATLFMTLASAFATVLYRYSGQAEFLLGTPIANRTQVELEGLIGFFANTLVLRMNLEGDPSFRELVQRVRETTLAAYAHQDVPFERLVEVIQPARDLSRSPLFQVMLVLQNAPQAATTLPGLTVQELDVDSGTSKFDLTLTLTETPTGLQGVLEYSTDLFDAATIERLWGHFQTLLEAGVARPNQRVSGLPLLTDTEQQQLLITWNATQAAFGADECLHHLVEAQAERTPEAVALVWPGTESHERRQLTYRELNERANQLAHHLQSVGVGPETLIGLYLERCPDLIVGMLAILKSGAAYVPMDPAYPAERVAFILEDAQAAVLITQSHLLAASGKWQVAGEQPSTIRHQPSAICLDTDWPSIEQSAISNPQSAITPSNLAYLIYTSGSTGRPKGVALTHHSAAVFVQWARQVFSSEVLAGVLAATSICFDLSIFELFVPLSVGGTVVLAENALELPALTGERITLVNTVPSAIAEILRQGGLPDSVRVVNLAGEALRGSLVQQIYAVPTVEQVFNLYGPSEDTTYSTFTLVNRDDSHEPTIGRPIANTQAYILDAHLQPVPIGVTGDLYLGGHGLARGYWERPDLTAEKFIPNPFLKKDEVGRMKDESENLFILPTSSFILYKTGDLARYLPNGNIEFLGRRDHQVKVRGFRIELGEIETALGQHPAIRECVVMVREMGQTAIKQLVAYIVPQAEPAPSITELRRFLKARLPDYMTPAAFVFLESFPLTPNGKVDRRALSAVEGPAPDGARPDLDSVYVAPRNPTEAALARIWAEVLQLEQIGVHDNFFELGGDSILTIQIVMKAKQAGWQITPKQLFQHQTLAELAAVAEAAAPTPAAHQRSEPFALAGLEPEALATLRSAEPQLEDLYPLSPMQAGMLFHSLRAPESGVYFRQWRCTLNTALDVPALQQAWQHAVRRHPILRTAFRWEQRATPMQAVYQDRILPWNEHDWRTHPERTLSGADAEPKRKSKDAPEVQAQRLLAFLRSDRERGFDLGVAPLMRMTLIRMADESYHFIWSHHQILLDGWSIPLILKEVFTGYERLTQGQTLAVEAGLPYREYLAWLQQQDMAQAEHFWRKSLAGLNAPTPLGVDHAPTRLATSEQTYAEQYLLLPAALTAELQAWARQHQLTLNTLVQGAWSLLLSHYSGENEVVFGVTTSGRPVELPQADAIVGLFVNTLPLRVSVEGSAALVPWLRTLQTQQAELRQYEYTPLVEVQGWSEVPRNRPLFESILIFENTPQDAELLEQGTRLGIETVESAQQANYALTVMAFPGVELNLGIGYDMARFDRATIERMLEHMQTLLRGMVAASEHSERCLGELSLLTDAERQQLLLDWNPAPPAPAQSLMEMFAEQVARTPNAIAATLADVRAKHSTEQPWEQSQPLSNASPLQLTYLELDQRSNQLAQYLRTLDVGPEVRVGVCLERSLQTLVALLAIFKAGGVYVPLDPSYPSAHLDFILRDTQVSVLITNSQIASGRWQAIVPEPERRGMASECPPAIIRLDTDWETISNQQLAISNPQSQAFLNNLAYIVYTSGSTGVPKGVAVPQQQLLNRFDWMWRDYPFAEGEVLCQRTTVNFSVSLWEFLGALLKGVPTVFVPDDVGKDTPRLIDTLSRYNVTRIVVVPSLLRTILEAGGDLQRRLSKLTLWSVCGEPLPVELYQQFRQQLPHARLINQYGASEANDVSHYDTCRYQSEMTTIPVGRPVTHTQVYLLDQHLQPVPVGVVGQVYVASAGLARGYWERPDLTAERFIPNPFLQKDEGGRRKDEKEHGDSFRLHPSSFILHPSSLRLYNMGDLARYLPDGTLELLGRRDHQVKIRGMRVELRGVEKALRQHSTVAQAVVTVHEDPPSERRLVAYVVSQVGYVLTPSDLREYLKEKLPDYMIPASFLFLEQMPLTPNGKIDRRALPAPDNARPEIAETYVAPRTPLEVTLAQLWAEVIGVERVGINDNFFELGGHSLMAAQLITRLHEILHGELPLAILFEAPTVANLAAAIEAQKTPLAEVATPVPSNAVTPDPAQRDAPFPLTDIQQAYWIGRQAAFELGNVGTHIYVELESDQLDLERFTWAWNQMIARHEMLRAIILSNGRQQILKDVPPYAIEVLDLRGHPETETQSELDAVRERMAREALAPDRWPLFEIRATRLNETRMRIHLKLDLLLADAWSSILIAQELSQVYVQRDAWLPPLELSFRDYVLAEQALQAAERYQRAQAYWWKRLDSLPPAPDLPLAKNPGSIAQPRFVRRNGQLEKDAWSKLKARAQQAGLTPSGVLLAAYAEALTLWSKNPRFTINLTLFNRLPLHPQVNQVIGDFTSLTLLAVDNSMPDSFEARARRLQEQLWQDLDQRAVSGVRVLREMFRREGGAPRAAMPVVFTSLLVQNLDREEDPTAQRFDLPVEVVYSAGQTPQVWLDHQVDEANGTLVFSWDSVDELFPEGLIDALLEAYCDLLRRLAEDESAWQAARAAQLPRSQLEQRQAVNATNAPIPSGLLHTLFAAQVFQRPEQVAVISGARTLSYAELAQRSIHLGRQLRELGARPNTLIAVVMQKGWEQVVGVLSILNAGAAYLPLSADLPQERLAYLLEHGQVEIVLTQSWLDSTLQWPADVKRICVDTAELPQENPHWLNPIQSSTDLAYVIYTSGSTGLPKGVMIDHRGAVNTIVDLNQRFHLGPDDRVLALSSLSFDLSVYDIFGTLAAGGTIVMPDASSTRDPAHWAKLVSQHQVTLWNSVPALMELFVEYAARHASRELSPRSLRLVWMSGDWIPITLPDQIRSLLPDAQIISMGGATEASIWSILYPIEHVDPSWKSIPYGQPMVNQTFHILNESLEPCPVWVPGELYIGGVGVAQGYWREEEKTRERFIMKEEGSRKKEGDFILHNSSFILYKTGDLGRYLPDGNIEFLGREDFQVKIQGYRIELGEIETALNQHSAVRGAAVVAVGDVRGPKRLAAYVVPNGAPPSVSELRAYLNGKLPAYMIPATYRFLDNLPLSANGKVDRRALPNPEESPQASALELSSSLPPSAEHIAKLVASVIGQDSLDPYANLLELGANSVDMIRVANHLEQELGFRPAIDEFYLSPTVLGLAQAYEKHLEQRAASVEQDSPSLPTQFSTPPLPAYKLLMDPDERAAFKRQQLGVRQDAADKTLVQLEWDTSEAQLKKYMERRTRRQFALQPIPFSQFSEFLSVLRQVTVEEHSKYRYGSAGGLYPVQTYLHLKPGSVEQLSGGTYYYHPVDHRLVLLNHGAEVGRDIHVPFINQPVFDEAAFSIFLVVQLAAIAPIYGERSLHFAAIEAGLMTQLLETSAVEQQIGLCQIGDVNFEPIRCLFDLETGHVLVHSLLGGRIDSAKDESSADLQQTSTLADRMLEKILQLSPEEVEALLAANETVGELPNDHA